MKTPHFVMIVLAGLFLILSVALSSFPADSDQPEQAYNAAIQRDCAPWDGAAFTLSIPLKDGTTIDISIWESPEIQFPVTFSFPDDTGQIGNALLIHQADLPDELTGSVSFSRVNQENPVEGNFDLKDENGNKFKGKFEAEWEDQIMLCG